MSDETIKGERIEFDARNPDKDPFKETDIRARKLMSADSKLSYQQAVRNVFSVDPELHEFYLDTDPPVHHNQGGA